MAIIAKPALKTGRVGKGRPHSGPPEEDEDEEDGLELPVDPDEGAPLIPDDDRVVMPW
ncbi:hypothetical protein [Polaromonas jejuensis]|uniref:Uncharacterized protein n=1 Tax=Polaromonas jejuensis TaxID=457502 RepID=A0ABW0Q575_9BURK|nr:hypothetical protein [Polaromonas jejuensis]